MPKPEYIRYKRNCDNCHCYYEGTGPRFCSRRCSNIWRGKNPKKPIAYRFWSKVNIPDLFSCWNWTAAKDLGGYGMFQIAGKTCRAHRFAFELCCGPIPNGKFICHSCDNPKCCNPSHMFPGTPKENVADMFNKNRQGIFIGERNSQSKLTEEDVLSIRSLRQQGMRQATIAAKFDMSPMAISRIVLRKTWTHI